MDQHFQTTTLLIKAFNHKFHLDLELNKYCLEMHNLCALPIYPYFSLTIANFSHLLAPDLIQKHLLVNGAQHISTQVSGHFLIL